MGEKERIKEILKEENDFLVLSHSEPDGDAVGSLFAMGHVLKAFGKEFFLFNSSGIPDTYNWLNPPKEVKTDITGLKWKWAIFLDCSNIDRVENFRPDKNFKIINIDHHVDNTLFGDVNWVDSSMSSVGEMVAQIADELNVSIKGDLAEALFLSIVSDTGSFSYGNTTPSVLRLAAKILDNGFDLNKFTANLTRQWSINKAHLHGLALVNSRLELNGKVGIIKVTQEMLKISNATVEDCTGLVNYMRQIKGVLVALSLREEEKGLVKFSLRSWGEVDVQKIAADLGGGGHPNASGGKIFADIEKAEKIILKTIEKNLRV